jgi:hypothetical protein
MNLRRGLFRLWLVGSALFVLAVAVVSYAPIKAEFEGVARNAYAPSTDEQIAAVLTNVRPPSPWTSVGTAAAIALGIPLAVLALGASLVWAFSGFATKRKSLT